MEQKIEVYVDDNVISLMERLQFHLMEMGIRIEVAEADEERIIYRMRHAEQLPPDENEKKE